MKINKTNAIKLWESTYGGKRFAEDFHGYLMCKDGYGNPDYYVYSSGENILWLEHTSYFAKGSWRDR